MSLTAVNSMATGYVLEQYTTVTSVGAIEWSWLTYKSNSRKFNGYWLCFRTIYNC